jgi:ligand-binding sensor domain-containing protein
MTRAQDARQWITENLTTGTRPEVSGMPALSLDQDGTLWFQRKDGTRVSTHEILDEFAAARCAQVEAELGKAKDYMVQYQKQILDAESEVTKLKEALRPAEGLTYMTLEDCTRTLDRYVENANGPHQWAFKVAQQCVEAIRQTTLIKAAPSREGDNE